jgi:hypothetical protein
VAKPNSWSGLIDQWEPRLQRAFLDSIYNLRDAAHIDQIIRMLENGDVDGALRAVGIDPVAFRPFDKSLTAAYEAGGEATAALVPVVKDADGFRSVFQFSVRNPEAESWIRDYSGNLIREIVDDQRTAVRNFLAAGLAEGSNPRTTALDLVGRLNKATGNREGGVIGLTSSQEEWVRNYAAELASDDPSQALTRELRDKRFDRVVARAASEGRPLTQAEIDPMVRAYKTRALRLRGETIARKETITALHSAQEQAMQQAVSNGNVDKTAVTYIWRTAHDSRVRETHQPMDGQVRRMGQPFITGSGARLRFPGDPEGPAAEVINCRCYREPKIDLLAGIK